MKVLAINGSPHAEGNTYHALRLVADELEKEGIEVEFLQIGNKAVRGCLGCGQCAKRRDGTCALGADGMDEWVAKVREADGLLLGSPVHFAGMSGAMKCFMDRLTYICGNNGGLLRHKVGACVTAVRRAGGIQAVDDMMHYLTYSEMLIPTSNYWNVIYGRKPGEVLQDTEGVQIMRILGRNMAWLLKMRQTGLAYAPEAEAKAYMHFIR